MPDNYERILKKISESAGVAKEEIERKIEAKRAKLSGLISREGAAQIVAAELGVSFDNEKLKINELLPGMRRVSLVGKVISIFPVREFEKNGKKGKVANMVIADETSNIKLVLWDTNHIGLIETGKISIGGVIEISNASMRENEIHLGSFSEFRLSNITIEDVKTERISREKTILDLKNLDNAKTRAFIVQLFEPRFFHVCPECKKKAILEGESFICAQHGKVPADKRALMNFVIDDGTSSIRAVVFHENLKKMGIENFEQEELIKQRERLLGMEMFFLGSIRNNKIFNTPEFIVDSVEEINLDNLIEKLEKN
jgi:replication factor A1